MAQDLIFIESDDDSFFNLLGGGGLSAKAARILRDAIDDIADRIEAEASDNAPYDKEGRIKAHPVHRVDAKRRVKGPGGLVVRTQISVPDEIPHKFVHDGTGIYGPRGRVIIPRTAPFMVFEIDGKLFRRHEVYGQRPQPYLKEAMEDAERSYIPIKLAELRAELELLT